MLEIGRPEPVTETPDISASSVNVPSPLFLNRKFGTVSLVTKTSSRPSRLKSANAALMPFADMREQAGLGGDILERAVSFVSIKTVGQALEDARVAINLHAASVVAAGAIGLDRPLNVIHDQQIQPAVVVVVEPAARDRPFTARDA